MKTISAILTNVLNLTKFVTLRGHVYDAMTIVKGVEWCFDTRLQAVGFTKAYNFYKCMSKRNISNWKKNYKFIKEI